MNKIVIVLCVSIVLISGIVGSADAYTGLVEATFFIDGVDLHLGNVYHDKSILIIVYGPINELDELLKPEDDFINFNPTVDIYFEFDPTEGISLAFALEENLNQPDLTGVAKIEGTSIGDVSPNIFSGLNFEKGLAPVFFDMDDTIILETSANEYIAIGIIDQDEFTLTVQIGGEGQIIPEPSTLLFLGLGLLGLVGIIRRWRKKGKLPTTLLLLMTIVSVPGLFGSVQPVAAHEIEVSAELCDGIVCGSISPSGTVQVDDGKNQTFTITLTSGYRIKEVLIDGKSIGPVPTTYTLENVTGDWKIEVTFIKDTFKLAVITKKCLKIIDILPLVFEKIECDSGMVMAGNEGVCRPGCTMIVAPFSKNTGVILKAEGAERATFERWEPQDGGVVSTQKDINLDAIFRRLPGGPSDH